MNVCYYCEKPIEPRDEVPTRSYWSSIPFVAHAGCVKSGVMSHAYECQLIDADCNDCRYFLRAEQGKWTTPGWCARFEKMTVASPNKWTGHHCFVHRREPRELIERVPE